MATEKDIKVPDIGGAAQVDVIEILVKPGDAIDVDTSLITLESDKASMEIPSPVKGVVKSIQLKVGDKISQGDVILTYSAEGDSSEEQENESKKDEQKEKSTEDKNQKEEQEQASEQQPSKQERKSSSKQEEQGESENKSVGKESEPQGSSADIHAGPAARRLARVLGVNLSEVLGSGRNARIGKEDVEDYVRQAMTRKTPASAMMAFPAPGATIDFSQFGEIETKPLNKIKRLTGNNVYRSWMTIPHVTQFDEADITELEAFRRAELDSAKQDGIKITVLAFVCKVVASALKAFPFFNASLDSQAENLIYKHYVNIGVAVETPQGLVVPVIKKVDELSIKDIAKEMSRLSSKARDKGLMPGDMSGGCFTISSLGGIGGTAFTPIVNSPEVAILGLSRASVKPVYLQGEFKPRLMLPLSLSYDHRVIDGAEAARFTRFLCEALGDIRKILL